MSALAVYDGTKLLGYVGNTARGVWEAQDDAGRTLGVHPTLDAAKAAVRAALAARPR